LDDVHIFTYNSANQLWFEDNAVWDSQKSVWVPKLTLGHGTTGVGLGVYPCAAGIAVSQSGKTMVVANYYNDSLSILTGGYGNWALEDVSGDGSGVYNLDLRPGKNLVAKDAAPGVPGGEYPFWVVITGDDTASPSTAVAYVSSIRDREIDVVPLSAATDQPFQVATRIAVKGQPNKMVLNSALNVLYVAEDQSDTVDVIDVSQDPKHYMTVNTVIETIPVLAPAGLLPSSFYYSGSNSRRIAALRHQWKPERCRGGAAHGNEFRRLRRRFDTDRLVSQLRKRQLSRHLDVRYERQIPHRSQSGLVLQLWSPLVCAELLPQ